MYRSICYNALVIFLLGFVGCSTVNAGYILIENSSIDAGLISNNGNLTIDTTALVIRNYYSPEISISENFKLTATSHRGRFSGTLSIGSLLSATFNNLTFNGYGDPFLDYSDPTVGYEGAQFYADLTYTSGSLIGYLVSGQLRGLTAGFDANGEIKPNFDIIDFTATNLYITVGDIPEVVLPLPATILLFLPMLIGLFGIGFRNSCNNKRL